MEEARGGTVGARWALFVQNLFVVNTYTVSGKQSLRGIKLQTCELSDRVKYVQAPLTPSLFRSESRQLQPAA